MAADDAGLASRVGRRGVLAGMAEAWGQAPKRGGTLVMSIIPEPPTLVSAFNTAAPLTLISPKFFEGLVSYDFDVNPSPLLATAWSVAADGLSISFTLRQGVTWNDGKPFSSADVAFTVMELLKKFHPRGRGTLAPVTAVDTPDAHTAIFRLSRPAPAIMSALSSSEAPMLPKHIYEGSDPLANPRNNNPVGTGPFRLVQWQRGNFIELERNPAYWDAGSGVRARGIAAGGDHAGTAPRGGEFPQEPEIRGGGTGREVKQQPRYLRVQFASSDAGQDRGAARDPPCDQFGRDGAGGVVRGGVAVDQPDPEHIGEVS